MPKLINNARSQPRFPRHYHVRVVFRRPIILFEFEFCFKKLRKLLVTALFVVSRIIERLFLRNRLSWTNFKRLILMIAYWENTGFKRREIALRLSLRKTGEVNDGNRRW